MGQTVTSGWLRPPQLKHRSDLFALALMSLVLVAQLFLSTRQLSQTWDEAVHLYAGYRYWQAADFGLNPEHPPLAKLVATIPVVGAQLKVPTVPQGYFKGAGFVAGREFLFGNDAETVLNRARMAASFFTIMLVLLVFEVGWRMFGPATAVLAVTLTVFEPNVLAHGALVTTDMAITCCLFAAVYSFFRYVTKPTRWKLAACGFTAGLALAAKHSGVIVFPILVLLAASEVARGRTDATGEPGEKNERRTRRTLRLAGSLLATAIVAYAVLWSFYGLHHRARPEGLAISPAFQEFVNYLNNPFQRRLILNLGRLRLLPESYVYGLADVALANEGRPAFLLGKLYPQGVWFYFPAAFAIKSTLPFLLLLASGVLAVRRRLAEREILFLTIPAGLYSLVCLTSRLNIGVRHLLPAYPFLIVLAAAGACTLIKRRRHWAYVVGPLVCWHALSSLLAYPDYLAYSNEIWGGPSKTYRVLSDSECDWGQGLKAVAHYLKQRSISECWLAYNGTAMPSFYGVNCNHLPDALSGLLGEGAKPVPESIEGTVLVSATYLSGMLTGPGELNPYLPFQKVAPSDCIHGSILVFRGRFDTRLAAAESYVSRAWQLIDTGQIDKAIAEARRAVALAPQLSNTHGALGLLLKQKEQKEEARRELSRSLALARSTHPEYQRFWISYLERQLALM